ncbi:MAG: DNA internalization-related competence protein ComEC/Rec2 [Gemmatimonadetes bacterium]|nr:DNA internalization-related competence protein ComEC/Rec2 [Gemmatimonadota bacterium]
MGLPPVVQLALVLVAGVGWGLLGAPIWMAPLPGLLVLGAPILASTRPASRRTLAGVAVIGALATSMAGAGAHCPLPTEGTVATLEGRFVVALRSGSAPFERADGCGTVTFVGRGDVDVGRLSVVRGTWRSGSRGPWLQGQTTASLPIPQLLRLRDRPAQLRWTSVAWRDELVERLHRLYGPRATVVTALILARKEGMDPAMREIFAATGIAHLLAISGFHVGVVAGMALSLLRIAGVGGRNAALGAGVVAWLYVALIGLPDSALRAALILTFVAMSRSRGRPPARWGALAAAAVVLLVLDPMKLTAPGFQLSFAGAAGLVAWAGPWTRFLERRLGPRVVRPLVTGLAAGCAATVATLPIVAWHFERVSLVGIPMTLIATPLVTLALPGGLLSLGLDFVSPSAATFFAGGVSVLLDLLVSLAELVARWPAANAWTSRGSVLAALVGIAVAAWIARRPGVGASGRRGLLVLYSATGIVAWPLLLDLERRGSLEVVMIDVGQGDAIAIRTPRGRWVLVDAGPPAGTPAPPGGETRAGDPRSHPVVRDLRRRGVDRLEVLYLTHPDLDHIGGAEAVLASFEVGRVVDPALPAPKMAYAAVLSAAARLGVPWSAARAGQRLEIDEVEFRVLHPREPLIDPSEANASSVVLLVSWRGFQALLTGDAYVDVERHLIDEVGDLDLLKVGHHGSDTSTDSLFLSQARPEIALISVGRRNRYGHPSPGVVGRLERAGAVVHRTDREGAIRVLVRPDGAVNIRTDRADVSPLGRDASRDRR